MDQIREQIREQTVMSQVHSVQVQVHVLSSKYKYLYSKVTYIQIQASG